jgi:hypothetical protein
MKKQTTRGFSTSAHLAAKKGIVALCISDGTLVSAQNSLRRSSPCRMQEKESQE